MGTRESPVDEKVDIGNAVPDTNIHTWQLRSRERGNLRSIATNGQL